MSKHAPLWIIADNTFLCPNDPAWARNWPSSSYIAPATCFEFLSTESESDWELVRDHSFFEWSGISEDPLVESDRPQDEQSGENLGGNLLGTRAYNTLLRSEGLKRFRFRFRGSDAKVVLLLDSTTRSITLSIDGGEPTEYPPENYLERVQSRRYTVLELPIQGLSDGKHIVEVACDTGFVVVNHALIKVPSDSSRTPRNVYGTPTTAYARVRQIPQLAFIAPSDPNLGYSGLWEDVDDVPADDLGRLQMSGKQTIEVGATIQFSFRGTKVWLLGWTQPGDGEIRFGYHLDGHSPISRLDQSSSSVEQRPMLLYEAVYNSPGVHNFTVELQKIEGIKSFVFGGLAYDLAEVRDSHGLPDIPLPGSTSAEEDPVPDPTLDADPTSQMKPATLAGIIVGAVLGFLLIMATVIICLRRRKQKARGSSGNRSEEAATPYEKSYNPPFAIPTTPSPAVEAPPSKPRHEARNNGGVVTTPPPPSETDVDASLAGTPPGVDNSRTGDAALRRTTPSAVAPEDNPQLFRLFMNWLNTHYDYQDSNGSQPPAYPGSVGSPSISDAQSRRDPERPS